MKDDAIARKSRELLDDSVEHMDAATASRLHQARSRALETRSRQPWFNWAAAGTLAAGIAVAVVFVDRQPPPLPTIYEDPVQQAAAEDLELMDDLDFVAWLVMEEGEPDAVDQSS